jgi:hypothetical protein
MIHEFTCGLMTSLPGDNLTLVCSRRTKHNWWEHELLAGSTMLGQFWAGREARQRSVPPPRAKGLGLRRTTTACKSTINYRNVYSKQLYTTYAPLGVQGFKSFQECPFIGRFSTDCQLENRLIDTIRALLGHDIYWPFPPEWKLPSNQIYNWTSPLTNALHALNFLTTKVIEQSMPNQSCRHF